MSTAGLSKVGLERMHRVLSGYVERQEIAGLVALKRDQIFRTPGRFGWDGGLGTSGYTDPAERMIGILLTQRMLESPQAPKVFTDFWTTAYAAME